MTRTRTAASGLMLVLSFSTGILDAATYLGLHGVFAANMTGNVILIGLAVGNPGSVHLLLPLLALAGFSLGALIAGAAGRDHPPGESIDRLAGGMLIATGFVLGGATLAIALTDLRYANAATLAIGVAMGVQAIAARRIGVPDVTTVVITSTLAGLFSEAGWHERRAAHPVTARRAAAVLTMFAGAVAGGLLVTVHLVVVLVIALGLITAVGASVVIHGAAGGGVQHQTANGDSRH